MEMKESYDKFKSEVQDSLNRATIQLGYLENNRAEIQKKLLEAKEIVAAIKKDDPDEELPEEKTVKKYEDQLVGAEQMVTQTQYIIKENTRILEYLDNYKL